MKNKFLAWGLLLATGSSMASQLGPVFPTHRFPTDESFHLGYTFGGAKSISNFDGGRDTLDLQRSSDVVLQEHKLSVEYQPNRNLNFGGYLSLLSVKVVDRSGSDKSSGLGDQRIFSEYRFFDEPGKSAGFAIVAKFPAYKNPTSLQTLNGKSRQALRGDAQTDFTGLLTSELWLNSSFRSRFDFGYTYRTEQFSAEIPYMLSIAYVNPAVDLELRFRGNASVGNDTSTPANDVTVIRNAFAGSDYALSKNPTVLVVEPTISFWFAPDWALDLQYSKSLMGNGSPNFYAYQAGFTYRWAQTKVQNRKTYKDVSIDTDQGQGSFDGEEATKRQELRAREARPIEQEADEEFPDPNQ